MKFKNVQALRAIAAILVVGAHLYPLEQKCIPGQPFLKWFEPLGVAGVDLFFVISGFVIITSTWSSFAKPGIGQNFILRRAARIFPVYWVVLIPIALLDIFAPRWVNSSQVIRPDIFASFALLPQAGIPLLTVSWSLVYEMYFYYIYAIAINFHATLLPWILGAWMLLTAAIFFAFPQTKMPYLAQMGNTITYEFSYGLLIGWWQIQKRKPIAALPIIAVGTVIVLLNTAFYSGYGSYLHGPLRFLFVGLPMAFILYGFVGLEVNKQFTCAGLIVLLGDASYSLYLWHAPILDAIGHLSMHRHILSQPIFHWLWLALSTAIVIAIALLLYRTIEYRLVRAFGKLLHLKSPGSILPNVSAITPSN